MSPSVSHWAHFTLNIRDVLLTDAYATRKFFPHFLICHDLDIIFCDIQTLICFADEYECVNLKKFIVYASDVKVKHTHKYNEINYQYLSVLQ